MTLTETLALNAPLEIKATVWLEYHNDREVAYKAVEDYCAAHDIFTDGSITNVMTHIFHNADQT